VSHLPFLDKLTSLLVVKESLGVFSSQNGAILKMIPKPDGMTNAIQWALTKQLTEQALMTTMPYEVNLLRFE